MIHPIATRSWFKRWQIPLLMLANTSWGRKKLAIDSESSESSVGNNRIIEISTDYIKWDNKNGTRSVEIRTHQKFSKRIYYTFLSLWKTAHSWDMSFANPFVPSLNLGFDTTGDLFPAAGSNSPMDGYCQRDLGAGTPETFSTLRSAAGNGSSAAPGADRCAALDGSTTSDQYKRMNRAIFGFDTGAAIGDSDTVTAATFSLSPTAKGNGLGDVAIHCCLASPASSSAIANSDYGNLGTTTFGNIAYAGWTADGGYDDFTLNASGIAAISTTTYTFLGTRTAWDILNDTTGLTWSSGAATRFECIYADNAGTTRDPKLVVTYTPAGGGTAVKDLIGGGFIPFAR